VLPDGLVVTGAVHGLGRPFLNALVTKTRLRNLTSGLG
jgi:hypothetical protein